MKSNGTLTFYNTWAVLYCDEGIRAYYTRLLERQRWLKLMKPRWGSHISVIRGEEVSEEYKHLWKLQEGKSVEFEYSVEIEEGSGGNGYYYYWLPIDCEYLLDVREGLGLPRYPITSNGLHLTLGQIGSK